MLCFFQVLETKQKLKTKLESKKPVKTNSVTKGNLPETERFHSPSENNSIY